MVLKINPADILTLSNLISVPDEEEKTNED